MLAYEPTGQNAPGHTPSGRAVLEAAAQRLAGVPVYLRYAGEPARDADDLIRRGAEAIVCAGAGLGPPVDVYAAGVFGPDQGLRHLALTVRHQDGAVALLGLGLVPRSPGSGGCRQPASLLLLGDQGAVEGTPAPPIGSGRTEIATTERGAGAPAVPAAPPTQAVVLDRYAAAIRRSLAAGRPEALDDSH